MNALKHLIARYTTFLWHTLQPLGIWGVFVVAVLDGAAIGLPVDVAVGGYVSQNHHLSLVYVLLAAAGSAIGSLVIYAIGYTGGEELLRKRVSPARFEKMHNAFEKHPFWSLMFPALLPPPTPFKVFALAAAVAEMSVSHFIFAIFFGRLIRFALLAILVIYIGPEAVHVVRTFFTHHFHWVVLLVLVALFTWWIVRRKTRTRTAESPVPR